MAQGTDRKCMACGETFTGRYRKCPPCREYRIERTCECGTVFRGETLKCLACRAAERQCIKCGATFTGRYQQCDPCRKPPKPCVVPGCTNPKVPGQGSKACQQHRDDAHDRMLGRLRRMTCYMPDCQEPKLVGYTATGRRRPYRYCAKHSAEAPQREREQIVRRRRERQFGLTHDQFLAMYAAQGGVCAICGTGNDANRQLSVDHDHSTGAVRSLLCDRCNPMLGYARDSITVLEAAIEYLKSHKAAGRS